MLQAPKLSLNALVLLTTGMRSVGALIVAALVTLHVRALGKRRCRTRHLQGITFNSLRQMRVLCLRKTVTQITNSIFLPFFYFGCFLCAWLTASLLYNILPLYFAWLSASQLLFFLAGLLAPLFGMVKLCPLLLLLSLAVCLEILLKMLWL